MTKKINIDITQVTFHEGKTKQIDIKIDDKLVHVPVDKEHYAYFKEQFLRRNPTALQSKRFATIMNVLRAAYVKGKQDGSRKK